MSGDIWIFSAYSIEQIFYMSRPRIPSGSPVR